MDRMTGASVASSRSSNASRSTIAAMSPRARSCSAASRCCADSRPASWSCSVVALEPARPDARVRSAARPAALVWGMPMSSPIVAGALGQVPGSGSATSMPPTSRPQRPGAVAPVSIQDGAADRPDGAPMLPGEQPLDALADALLDQGRALPRVEDPTLPLGLLGHDEDAPSARRHRAPDAPRRPPRHPPGRRSASGPRRGRRAPRGRASRRRPSAPARPGRASAARPAGGAATDAHSRSATRGGGRRRSGCPCPADRLGRRQPLDDAAARVGIGWVSASLSAATSGPSPGPPAGAAGRRVVTPRRHPASASSSGRGSCVPVSWQPQRPFQRTRAGAWRDDRERQQLVADEPLGQVLDLVGRDRVERLRAPRPASGRGRGVPPGNPARNTCCGSPPGAAPGGRSRRPVPCPAPPPGPVRRAAATAGPGSPSSAGAWSSGSTPAYTWSMPESA